MTLIVSMHSVVLVSLGVVAAAFQALAIQLPLSRRAVSRSPNSLSTRSVDISGIHHAEVLSNEDDMVYTVNITLGSLEIPVIVDTGSTDLWIREPTSGISLVNSTSVVVNMTYAKGQIAGPIQFAEMTLAGMTIPSQAFINANEVVEFSSSDGLMGLGFDTIQVSRILHALDEEYGAAESLSRSPIANIFHQNPAIGTFFTLLLGRGNDPNAEDDGAFTIGEYLPQYKSIADSPKLENQTPIHWGVLVDDIRIGNRSVPLNSSVPSVPTGKMISALDSGASFSFLPVYLVDSIYSGIPGAVRVSEIHPDLELGYQWVLPCDHAVDVVLTIGGVEFPVNPLDLTRVHQTTIGENYTICINTFQERAFGSGFRDFDILLGDSFLRSVYAAFHYGSSNSSEEGVADGPFVQLLPTTDMAKAHEYYPSVRAAQLDGRKVVSPSELRDTIRALLGLESEVEGDVEDEKDDDSTTDSSSASASPPVRGVLSATDDKDERTPTSDFVTKFGPVVVGLLAGNLFLLIIISVIAVYLCVSRRGKARDSRVLPLEYQPLRLGGGGNEKQLLEPVHPQTRVNLVEYLHMSSAVAEVLSTPKFLLRIVSLSTQKDNASNLLVNKAWAEEVMNIEWRDVDQVQWLLGLLAPFEEIEPPEDAEHDLCTLRFVRAPESSDWDRFHRYAARVKYLIHEWNMFDPSVYATLSRYQDQTRTIFFPNLHHLCCLIDTDSLGLFLRPGLHSLTICYDLDRSSMDIQRLEKSFFVITQKCTSSLQELFFNYRLGDDLVRSSEHLLISALRELRHLRTITIPSHWLSERVTQALALLPALARLDSTGNGFSKRRTAIVPTFSTSLNKNSFPSLNHLHLVIHFDEAIPSFNSWDHFESPETYEALVKVIVKAFPFLRMLYIHANAKHLPPSMPTPQLTFRALEPILCLQDLRTLKISYTTPLYLVTGDLFEIFWSLASITSLELNPNPPI
ncbi:hypothetical protein ONZ45_g7820 [Pleurotus djamor]|nr:hypothetical protein ONZ45_g7820 [Pleurotus djamor]